MILFTFLSLKNVMKSRNKINSNSSSSSKKTIKNDRKFAISSITINVLFLILNFPHLFLGLVNGYTTIFENFKDLFLFLQGVFLFFLYINLISTFFVHYCVNSIFKSEFEQFKCRNNSSGKNKSIFKSK